MNVARFRAWLPLTDPIRRARVRRAARRLVGRKAWAGDEATGRELAGLALLRCARLATEARRASAAAANEAAGMAARGALEAALTGIYALYHPAAAEEFAGEVRRGMTTLVAGPVGDILGDEFIGMATAEMVEGSVPRSMAKLVEAAIEGGGGPGLARLPRELYQPLSTLVVHTSTVSLARHVNYRRLTTRRRPGGGPSPRWLSHLAEGSVGLLASEIAGQSHPDYGLFSSYALSHFNRVRPPLLRFGWRIVLGNVDPKGALRGLRRYVALRRQKTRTGQIASREELVDLAKTLMSSIGGQSVSEEAIEKMVDHLYERLVPAEGSIGGGVDRAPEAK